MGSTQFVTDWKGRQYEHIEYTPYGELWTYKSKTAKLFLTTYNNFLAKQPEGLIEETAPGIDKLPFRFTGKELDEETGLYYYGARYLDPKYSRWLSGDPALNDYIPKAPIDDEAKKHSWNGGKKLILIMKKDFVGMMIVVKIIGKGVIIYMSEVKTIFL